MITRVLVAVVALAFGAAAVPMTGLGQDQPEAAIVREEELEEIAYLDDDDDTDDSRSGFTSGRNSNDRTDSRHTPVTRDRDRSRGDLTRDRTKDGPGTSTRDRTRNQTNDRTRRDTR